MILQTHFRRKEPVLETTPCEIVAAVELSDSEFVDFQEHLLNDQPFIESHADQLYVKDGIARCLLVYNEQASHGILVNSEGASHAQYSSVLPEAKTILGRHLDEVAKYCVREGIAYTSTGKWSISFDEIYEHFGIEINPRNGLCSPLLDRIKQQKEVDEIIATEDELEIQYHLEYCSECQQGGLAAAMSLMSLIGCNINRCNITVDGCDKETCCIENFNLDTLTDEGKQEFADVLNAKVTNVFGASTGAKVKLSGCTFERAKRLADILRQECPLEEYYKYVAPKPGEIRTPMKLVTQHDIEVAHAEHTLWRLGHPNGRKAVFENCDLFNICLDGKDFSGAVFSNSRLRTCTAENAMLSFASFCHSKIDECYFADATIENSDWTDATVKNSELLDVSMENSNLTNATFDTVNLGHTDLQNSCLAGATFNKSFLEVADTHGCVYSLDKWDTDSCQVIR